MVEKNNKLIDAEAKLISALSNLIWVVPSIIFFEIILAAVGFEGNMISGESLTSVLIALIGAVIGLKIIELIGNQLTEWRESIYKLKEMEKKRKDK